VAAVLAMLHRENMGLPSGHILVAGDPASRLKGASQPYKLWMVKETPRAHPSSFEPSDAQWDEGRLRAAAEAVSHLHAEAERQ
jgi:hypothetical protein